jgi:hypothetical protein
MICQDILSLGRDLNLRPPEYEVGMLTTRQTATFGFLGLWFFKTKILNLKEISYFFLFSESPELIPPEMVIAIVLRYYLTHWYIMVTAERLSIKLT